MESPCRKCKKFNVPYCIKNCKRLKEFQNMLFEYDKLIPIRYDYDPGENSEVSTI